MPIVVYADSRYVNSRYTIKNTLAYFGLGKVRFVIFWYFL